MLISSNIMGFLGYALGLTALETQAVWEKLADKPTPKDAANAHRLVELTIKEITTT